MTCPVCGKPHPCAHASAHSRAKAAREWEPGANSSALIDRQAVADGELEVSPRNSAAGISNSATGTGTELAWRQEVVTRVRQHRARRRPADPNAMELDFTADEPYSFESRTAAMPPPPERFAEIMVKPDQPKIIRFPRSKPAPLPAVQEVMLDELELAEPVPETPRIVEAQDAPDRAIEEAEQMELLPSFADIHLEPDTSRLDDELELIPRPAPLSQRAAAGLVDAAIVLIASGTFAVTFLKLAEEMPQSKLTMVCALAAGGTFWLLFQYLFLTYGRGTPGMRMAHLELCTFEGKPASLFARRCRAAASALSAFCAGLGYAWALIDEDRLGWHDRISQTHLRGSTQL
jgi:uncharacterized RDD family membrane protein YckC